MRVHPVFAAVCGSGTVQSTCLLAALLLWTSACALTNHIDDQLRTRREQLCASRWVLETIDGRPPTNFEGLELDLVLDQDGRVHGYAGVNHYSGAWILQRADELRIRSIATTRRLGPTRAMQQEKLFLDRLARVSTCELAEDRLLLGDAERGSTLLFRARLLRDP